AGWLVPYDRDFYLIVEDGESHALDEAVKDLAMIGLDRIGGDFTDDVVEAWAASGRAAGAGPQLPADGPAARPGEVAVLAGHGRGRAPRPYSTGLPHGPARRGPGRPAPRRPLPGRRAERHRREPAEGERDRQRDQSRRRDRRLAGGRPPCRGGERHRRLSRVRRGPTFSSVGRCGSRSAPTASQLARNETSRPGGIHRADSRGIPPRTAEVRPGWGAVARRRRAVPATSPAPAHFSMYFAMVWSCMLVVPS